ncbi:MAG: SapB/AmfS family lanthipeptide [Mycobacteriales bacterium]
MALLDLQDWETPETDHLLLLDLQGLETPEAQSGALKPHGHGSMGKGKGCHKSDISLLLCG